MRNWYIRNQDKITWFIIGWLCFAATENLLNGNYIWAAILGFLAWVNYSLEKVRLQ